jgi:hypothetical protein
MTRAASYDISAFWGPRLETPEELAARWIELMARLQAVDPLLAHWYDADFRNAPIVPYVPDKARVAKMIAAGVLRSDQGKPDPFHGYHITAYTTAAWRRSPRRLCVDLLAGNADPYSTNAASLSTDFDTVPDPAIITYEIFKSAVLALGECFDAAGVRAYPSDLSSFWTKIGGRRKAIDLAWISYIAPRFAAQITPPSSAIVEYQPDGGLLMAATDETFVTSNPAHLAVSRDIEAACAPFNALPYPPEEKVS